MCPVKNKGRKEDNRITEALKLQILLKKQILANTK